MPDIPEGRVARVAEDERRGTFTLQALCRCGWRGPAIVAADTGSTRHNAPPTNRVARDLVRHQQAVHG